MGSHTHVTFFRGPEEDGHGSTGAFVRHEACPSCGSRNNLARYSDGNGFCFGCRYFEKGDTSGGRVDTQSIEATEVRVSNLSHGSVTAIPNRRLDEETFHHSAMPTGYGFGCSCPDLFEDASRGG